MKNLRNLFKKKFKVRVAKHGLESRLVTDKYCVQYSYGRITNWECIRECLVKDSFQPVYVYINVFLTTDFENAKEFAKQFNSYEDVVKHEQKIDDTWDYYHPNMKYEIMCDKIVD